MGSLFFFAGMALSGCAGKKGPEKESAPNIVLILADDMGYSDISCYGSEIRTPHIDQIAREGVRFRQFYNASRCCPSRASLLTGLYPHQAGMGGMTEGQKYPGGSVLPAYQGYLNDHCLTLAELLRENGYQTFISGKWHVGDSVTRWPAARGFDRSFSLIWGASNYFNTKPFLNENQKVVVTLDGKPVQLPHGFYFTDEFTRYAIRFIRERDPGKPFFLYLAYTAPHWPIQAPEEDINLYRGKYMMGWDSLRAERFRRMKKMGIIPEYTRLSPKYGNVPDWDTLSPEEKTVWDLRMAVYAAMIHRMDAGVGEVMDLLEEQGLRDNTIIMFLSDNGATNAEMWWATNWIADRSGEIGSEQSLQSYGKWANTSNTPFRLFKSHTLEGGIITPFIFSWPSKIKPAVVNDYPGHIIDIVPTVLASTHTLYPATYRNKSIIPLEGEDLLPVLNGEKVSHDRILYWEHFGNKAVRKGDWKLVSDKEDNTWHLYDLGSDPSETQDLSGKYPEKEEELIRLYDHWAHRVGVVPDSVYKKLELARNADWFVFD